MKYTQGEMSFIPLSNSYHLAVVQSLASAICIQYLH